MVDFSKLQEKYEQLNKAPGGGDNSDFLAKFLQLNMGDNIVRILPWRDDSHEFYAETSIHRIPSSKHDLDGNARNVHCLKPIGKKCPICDFYYGLWKTGKKTDEAIARKIRGRERYYMNALVRETGEVKILSVGKKLFSTIVGAMMDPDYGDITDLQKGHDFKIIKEMNGEYPNYDRSAPRPKSSTVGSGQDIDRIMGELHDIHTLVKHQDYSEMKTIIDEFYNGPKIMQEMQSNEVESDEQTEAPEPVNDQEYLERLRNSS